MSTYEDFTGHEYEFDGWASLFPLPNLVMFPHVVQPLHIFEPRYCDMTRDALAADGMLALGLLAPGWEADYDGRPEVFPHVCLGRVITHSMDAQGRYNLLMLGVKRARILREGPPNKSYRRVELELLEETYDPAHAAERADLHSRLLNRFAEILPTGSGAQEQMEQLLSSQAPLGMLVDIVSFTVGFDLDVKMKLLAELDVDQRATSLLELLENVELKPASNGARRPFPPEFSIN